jgi:hypothetical protein
VREWHYRGLLLKRRLAEPSSPIKGIWESAVRMRLNFTHAGIHSRTHFIEEPDMAAVDKKAMVLHP